MPRLEGVLLPEERQVLEGLLSQVNRRLRKEARASGVEGRLLHLVLAAEKDVMDGFHQEFFTGKR